MCDAFHHAAGDRVPDKHENDRNGPRPLLPPQRQRRANGDDHVEAGSYQLLRVNIDTVGIATTKTNVNPQVAPLGPAELLEALAQCDHTGLKPWIILGPRKEHPDPPHA